MSRIGKKPVAIPAGVQVAQDGGVLKVKGPKGELTLKLAPQVAVSVAAGQVEIEATSQDTFARAMHGTTRSLVSNMILGVHKGYTRELEIQGVGFKANVQGKKLNLALGYSHPINFEIPASIDIKVNDGVNLVVSGPDKQLVGLVSAQIRSYYPAEPYKGKGVRYKGEHVRRKAGKAVA